MTDGLLDLPLPDLMARARQIRDQAHGTRVTYSPKVFIPLTMLCRDKCGYCTFAQPPARLEAPVPHARRRCWPSPAPAPRPAATRRCSRSASAPRQRYPVAAEWLADARLRVDGRLPRRRCAALVLDETGLLPHANAGALVRRRAGRAAAVSRVSQGMMIESLDADLDCHRGSPDKTPERRLATLEAAGELPIPFTTGILVGIGENRGRPRRRARGHRRQSHRRHGHVQEVIVQNFLPKPGTAMHARAAVPARRVPRGDRRWPG